MYTIGFSYFRPQLFSGSKNASSHNLGEEAELTLRTFLKEQLEAKEISSFADIEAQYNSYVPILLDQNFQNVDGLADSELQLARQKVAIYNYDECLS
jgi:hypothetical protein